MAGLVLRGVVSGGSWVYRTLFVGSAVGTGAAAGTALNQVRQNAEAEPRTPARPRDEACATCRDPRCAELEQEMRNVVERRKGEDGEIQRGLRERADQMANPRQSLDVLERAGGGRGRRLGGHHQAWSDTQNQIIRRMYEWDRLGCGPYPPGIEEWATMPPPRPGGVVPP